MRWPLLYTNTVFPEQQNVFSCYNPVQSRFIFPKKGKTEKWGNFTERWEVREKYNWEINGNGYFLENCASVALFVLKMAAWRIGWKITASNFPTKTPPKENFLENIWINMGYLGFSVFWPFSRREFDAVFSAKWRFLSVSSPSAVFTTK